MAAYNIQDYGAVGDGKTLNTAAIQSAVVDCANHGGGTVIVPSGIFVSGSIELMSNVTIYLENGSVLKAADSPDHFPPIGFSHNEMHETTSLLWSIDRENILVCGSGTIDINADAYYKENSKKIYDGSPSAANENGFVYAKNNDRINQPLFFESCTNIKVEGIRLINSTCWTVTFSRSSDILVNGITIRNSPHVPNDDGVHLSACRNALISNCNISCLDDCIAVTSITAHGQENANIHITNCLLSSRSSAIRLGHKVNGVIIDNITIYDNNRGIGLFTAPGGYIQNVTVSNVIMHNRIFPSVCWGKGEAVVIAAAQPESFVRNIKFSNIIAYAANGILIFGHHNIEKVSFENADIRLIETENANNFIDLRPYHSEKTKGKAIKTFIKGAGRIAFRNTRIAFEHK